MHGQIPRSLSILPVLSVLLLPQIASAHIELTSPAARHPGIQPKDGPCGMAGSTRGDTVTVFAPGETIEVVFNEYVPHPGHFRIAFDADGQDDFVDPSCTANCNVREEMVIETYVNDAVLVDGIEDLGGRMEYRIEVTLPDIECENCTLQTIQVMTDKPPYNQPDPETGLNSGNDLYYHCADIALRRSGGDAGAPPADAGGGDAGTPGVDAGPGVDSGSRRDGGSGRDGSTVDAGTPAADDDGCSAAGGEDGAPIALALGVLAVLVARRRRD